MRTLPIPAALLALALFACGGDSATPTAPDARAAARAARGGAEEPATRRLIGRCETALAPTQVLAPGVVRQVDTGTCQLAHLGRAEFYSDKVINVASGTQTTEATFTAPNGDVLRAVGSGTNVPSAPGRVGFAATLAFVGGTGRFAQASGEAHAKGESDLVARTAALTLDGWIEYDAADRSAR